MVTRAQRLLRVLRSVRLEARRIREGQGGNRKPSLDKQPSVIDTLITAVRNGELDQQLAEAGKQATAPKPKGKRAA